MINFSPITWSCHLQMNLGRSEYDPLSTFFRQSNAKPVIIPIILKSRIHVPPMIQFSIRHIPFFIKNLFFQLWVYTRAPKYGQVILTCTEYEVVLGRTEYDREMQIEYESVGRTVILVGAKSYWYEVVLVQGRTNSYHRKHSTRYGLLEIIYDMIRGTR